MTTDRSHLTDRELTEQWQEFHGKHLARQTSALESIRVVLIVLLVLTIAGVVVGLAGL